MSRQERFVIIFLLVCALLGLGVSVYKKTHQAEIKAIPLNIKEIKNSQRDTFSRGLININTSSEEELTRLPGIGPTLAKSIVAYRKQNDLFSLPEDIIKVSGVGQVKYERIKPLITTENE